MRTNCHVFSARKFCLIGTTALMLVNLVPADVWACGGSPPRPVCSRSVALSKAFPRVIIVPPGGGNFVFPTNVFITSTGPCPPVALGRVTLTINCFGGAGAVGVGLFAPAPGNNPVNVNVFIPAGPPRLCIVTGVASVTWADGVTLIGRGDTVVCVVEPSPTDPGTPRLGMDIINAPIQYVHPSDQARYRVRLTNNDPTESVTIDLDATSTNSSRMPELEAGFFATGHGLHAISDPGSGDNYPVQWTDECISLPIDPMAFLPPTETTTVTLDPGDSQVVTLSARGWGMCADGSCSEIVIEAHGQWTDGTEALGCVGASLVLDVEDTPDYECPDTCVTSFLDPIGPNRVLSVSDVSATQTTAIITEVREMQILGGAGNPFPAGINTQLLDPTFARTTGRFPGLTQPFFLPGQTFDGFVEINIAQEDSTVPIQLEHLMLMPAGPGLEDRYFGIMARAQVPGSDFAVDSFFDVFYEISITGLDIEEQQPDIHILPDSVEMFPTGPSSFGVSFVGVSDHPLPIPEARLHVDTRTCGGVPMADTGCETPGDGDNDGDVDLVDFAFFQLCFGTSGSDQCVCFDMDGDGDVDLADFGFFQLAFTGS